VGVGVGVGVHADQCASLASFTAKTALLDHCPNICVFSTTQICRGKDFKEFSVNASFRNEVLRRKKWVCRIERFANKV
jgi:hypothetical protein